MYVASITLNKTLANICSVWEEEEYIKQEQARKAQAATTEEGKMDTS